MRKLSKNNQLELSIVILNFNAEKFLIPCLASIPTHPKWEIIVADNGSTDGSLKKAVQKFPNIKTVENGQNIGFAAGNNRAIRQSSGEFVLLLNPDTVVTPNAIETVLKYLRNNPAVGAATCRVELPDGRLDYSSHRGFPTPLGSLLHFLGLKTVSSYTYTNINEKDIHEIDALTGAFAMVRRTAGDLVGWLDERFYWNGEDLDFCWQLKKAGWKIVFIPQVKIIHYKGYASKATLKSKLRWAKNSTDVMKIFYEKNQASLYPGYYRWLVNAGIRILYIYRLIKSFL